MKEIKPTYVDFKTAKWLKEKGLDYHKIFEDFSIYYDYNVTGEYHRRHYSDFSESVFPNDLWIPIPEQHQVVEWLRFYHDIWVSVIKIDGFQDLYYYTITGSSEFFNNGRTITVEEWDDETCDKMGYNNKYFNSPQEAYSAAFDYIKDNNLI